MKINIPIQFNQEEFYRVTENTIKSLSDLRETLLKIDKRSKFEKFYDKVSNFIFGGKRTTLIIIISLFSNYMISQETKISAMAGYELVLTESAKKQILGL